MFDKETTGRPEHLFGVTNYSTIKRLRLLRINVLIAHPYPADYTLTACFRVCQHVLLMYSGAVAPCLDRLAKRPDTLTARKSALH